MFSETGNRCPQVSLAGGAGVYGECVGGLGVSGLVSYSCIRCPKVV